MQVACALAAASCALLAGACFDTQPCVSRGTTTTYGGSASYVGQTGADGGSTTSLVGAVPARVAVDDFTNANSCSGNAVEFTVRTGACVLWATSDDPDGGTASIEQGQTCGVPTAQGIATMTIDQGTLSAGSVPIGLTLSGALTDLGDAGVDDGYLQWTFSGQ